MSDRNYDNLNERQRLAQDAVRSLDRPKADSNFRARLKAQFVAGEIPANDRFPADDTPEAGNVVPLRSRRTWLGWAGLAAAAAVAFIMISSWRLPGPEIVASEGAGPVTVDGVPFAAGDHEALADALKPGARVEVGPDARIDVAYPGTLVMRIDAGTDIVLPARPGRWTGRSIEAIMAAGEISVRTGPDLAGGEFAVDTGLARAVIHGTLISVVRMPDLACICLFEGSADILVDGADLGHLPGGKRWVVFDDGREPQLLDIAPPHLEHMLGLDATLQDR